MMKEDTVIFVLCEVDGSIANPTPYDAIGNNVLAMSPCLSTLNNVALSWLDRPENFSKSTISFGVPLEYVEEWIGK
jgi:hypothetical protein